MLEWRWYGVVCIYITGCWNGVYVYILGVGMACMYIYWVLEWRVCIYTGCWNGVYVLLCWNGVYVYIYTVLEWLCGMYVYILGVGMACMYIYWVLEWRVCIYTVCWNGLYVYILTVGMACMYIYWVLEWRV